MNQSISPNNPETYQLNPAIAARVRFNDQGLVPAIAQAADTGEVLMLAWMDDHALAYTLATRRAPAKNIGSRAPPVATPNK